jgi:uncharacterized membrane protein YesL
MREFFSIDGKFYRFGTFVMDIITVGLLWTIFSIPLITIGATTTALYYVCTKKHSGDDTYLLRTFLKSFKTNFVKSTIIFLLLVFITFLLWINLHILGQIDMGFLNIPIRIALWFMLFQVLMAATNSFAIISRFEMTIISALRYGLFMGYRNFFTTFGNWVTLLAIFLLSIFFPMLILFMGGIYVYITSYSFVRVFKKHSEEFSTLTQLTQ